MGNGEHAGSQVSSLQLAEQGTDAGAPQQNQIPADGGRVNSFPGPVAVRSVGVREPLGRRVGCLAGVGAALEGGQEVGEAEVCSKEMKLRKSQQYTLVQPMFIEHLCVQRSRRCSNVISVKKKNVQLTLANPLI